MSVADSASVLFRLLSADNDTFTRYLLPGLGNDHIDRVCQVAGLVRPPTDVVALYEAFNVVQQYQYGPDQPTFYGIYWLLSFEDAIECWQERRAYDFLDPRWRDGFPLLQEDGNFYLVDAAADAAGNHQVIHDFVGLTPEPEFLNMTSMFDTFSAWLTAGVLPRGSGRVPGHYEGNRKDVCAIAARLNPGIRCWTEGLS